MDDAFLDQPLHDIAGAVRRGDVAAREVAALALARIEARNPEVNAFVSVDGDRALADAAAVDDAVVRGEDPGPLAGVPFGVKDLEDLAGHRTTHGSLLHADGDLAATDSVLVARLKRAGAVAVGKTNTPEFGFTAQTFNDVFGTTSNPLAPGHTPGGSSGGSGAALAAGMVPLCTGSDGGGSIRIPSALCGLPGFKPTLGRVPTGGPNAPDWPLLSTKGPMARRVGDLLAALDVAVGPDPTDFRSLPAPTSGWTSDVAQASAPRRIGWSPTLGYGECDAAVLAACRRGVDGLADVGFEIVEIGSVFDTDPVWPWLTLTNAYLRRTFSAVLGTADEERITPALRAQLSFGESTTGLEVVRAEDECNRLAVRLAALFADVDLLVCPVVAATAPRCGETGTIDGVPQANWVRFTYPFNMTRSPAGTVPVGTAEDGSGIGLQIVGPHLGDVAVLQAMAALSGPG